MDFMRILHLVIDILEDGKITADEICKILNQLLIE